MIHFIFVDNIVFESSVIFRGSRNINTFKNTCISLKFENSFKSKYMYSVKLRKQCSPEFLELEMSTLSRQTKFPWQPDNIAICSKHVFG